MEVKGTAVASVVRFVEEKFGNEALNNWRNGLAEAAKSVYSNPILASKWYSLNDLLVEPTKEICKTFYGGNLKGAWDAGKYSAKYGLNGILKIFVKMGTPNFIISRATSILPTYYKPSEIKVIENTSNKVVIRITQFPEPSEIIEHRIGGWIETALQIQGCKSVNVKITKSAAKNDEFTEYDIKWL